jgi:hypothetical protein
MSDEPKRLRFNVNLDSITLDEMIAMQEGQFSSIREVLAKSLVDQNGKPLKIEDARKLIGGLKLSQLNATCEAFYKEATTEAINPQSDEPSLLQ